MSPIETVVEDGDSLRKIVCTATIGATGKKFSLTQWFLPDKWILKKAKLDVDGKDG